MLPLFWHKDYPATYLNIVAAAGIKITKSQIEKLKADITVCTKALEHSADQIDHMHEYRKTFEPDIKQWYTRIQPKPVPRKMQLKLIDAYHQL